MALGKILNPNQAEVLTRRHGIHDTNVRIPDYLRDATEEVQFPTTLFCHLDLEKKTGTSYQSSRDEGQHQCSFFLVTHDSMFCLHSHRRDNMVSMKVPKGYERYKRERLEYLKRFNKTEKSRVSGYIV